MPVIQGQVMYTTDVKKYPVGNEAMGYSLQYIDTSKGSMGVKASSNTN